MLKASLILALFLQAAASLQTTAGTITGLLLSVDGTPAVGVRVSAVMPQEPNGPPTPSTAVSFALTDSKGRYQLEKVPAGRYLISAGLVNSPTYYPGVTALAR